ncbi:ATP-dependent DNA helicase yku80 [Cladophialophora chaetospira]|uniref:ATP-dependent DNA helicase II subunit 2 n=1 Tax=Cladophialophora chaetospira TaxID=386627 RepID=A0AA38WPE5_9EURO|nr:ATP-dependent DNA helicase yku80 [Cladophialophora chaetospira]
MADKEVTIFIVDVARSMGKQHNGRKQSDLDWSLQWVYDSITNIVFTGRKTLQVGVLGLGTDHTDNAMEAMEGGESYKHISVLQPVAQLLLPEVTNLPKVLKSSRTDDRDIVSAIILGVDMINRHCKHLKFKKKLFVVTNAVASHIDEDDIEQLAQQFKDNNIELTVLGVDFDDAEYGFKQEDKPEEKAKNEITLKQLVDLAGGQFGTMQEAIDNLSRPAIKAVRPTPTYRGQLRLGDPTQYDTALSIDVERYMKVSVRKPPTASAYVIRSNASADDMESENLQSVHNLYKYRVKGDDYEGGAKVLEREELAKGYEYGRTAVSISESEQNITRYETEAAYDILGFLPADNIERYMLMDNANIVVAQKGNDKAAMALSSLIHSLFELGSVAIGRLVKKDMTEPILTVLSPLVEADYESLVENVLPFAEDVRSYRFPPLDKVLTVSGKALTEHRNLPSKKLLDNMSDFVDKMMLVDEAGDEMMAIDDTFSPHLHTIEGAIKDRAVNANDPKKNKDVPERKQAYALMQKPPSALQDQAKPALEKLKDAADVKKVEKAKKGRGRTRDRQTEKPLSGLDIDALLSKTRPTKKTNNIDPNNAIPDFQRVLASTADMLIIKDTFKEMQAFVEDLVKNDYGQKNYDRVLELLGVMRTEAIGFEVDDFYNEFLCDFKVKLFKGQLGDGRQELWYKIRKGDLGLASKEENATSTMSKAEADELMKAKSTTK